MARLYGSCTKSSIKKQLPIPHTVRCNEITGRTRTCAKADPVRVHSTDPQAGSGWFPKVNEGFFAKFLNPNPDVDNFQNLISSSLLYKDTSQQKIQKIRSVVLGDIANRQTADRQTDKQTINRWVIDDLIGKGNKIVLDWMSHFPYT